ncbi:unnamed protein product [Ostreobium quekettii]|uniref:Haloacid dehalogenase-like hydrolase domain-containing protein 3 n=1 Tax=Ostreobium quekettii TaxID=121088 RepID=A0A8S1IQM0_9CHLO|nr:unnamed protein product [Ostreobium quekettii]|eukprot:evm.model.scf_173.7 EVM.evm.TU.scf_173.7   scf_173:76613-77407(+)
MPPRGPLLRRTLLLARAALPAPQRGPTASALAHARSDAPQSSPSHKALLVDAAGTLVSPSEPVAAVYGAFAAKHGVRLSEGEILSRFRGAFAKRKAVDAWSEPTLRYVGDGRAFWRRVVAQATGCDSEALFDEVYEHYESPEAWKVTPGAMAALRRLRSSGVKVVVVSNFDTRLRPLLMGMGLGEVLDEVVVSAEVGAEKPNPVIFETALEAAGVAPGEAVHVGDDRRNDLWGARDAGLEAWLWGEDVQSFEEVADKILGCGAP